MFAYVIKRLVYGVATILILATLIFFLMHAAPGDPLLGEKASSPEIRANLVKHYGLDQPLLVQYGRFMYSVFIKWDFGISYAQKNRFVNDIIREHFPVSAVLGLLAIVMAAVGGILFGALTALYRNKLPDRIIMILVIIGVSVPNFVFAAWGQFFIVKINAFFDATVIPVAGWGTFQHMLAPAFFLELGTLAYLTRLMRSSMLEVVNTDYIRTAKAKGLSPARIFFQHQFRNAILPIVTVLGYAFAAITTGGFVVETLFAVPGLGRYFVLAVQQLDYTVIMGTGVFYGSYLIIMANIIDIIYGFVDPRIRVNR
ncbi:MAG: peptide ABC transporter permease [Proteobacteria bacterium SG_bin7]|nr:MAG: peptide ABC transporter permease [Proteobacteria bacterium SG_bin7]